MVGRASVLTVCDEVDIAVVRAGGDVVDGDAGGGVFDSSGVAGVGVVL